MHSEITLADSDVDVDSSRSAYINVIGAVTVSDDGYSVVVDIDDFIVHVDFDSSPVVVDFSTIDLSVDIQIPEVIVSVIAVSTSLSQQSFYSFDLQHRFSASANRPLPEHNIKRFT